MEAGGVLPLPAVDAVFHHALQAGVRPDDGGQPAGQRLKVGQALGLALGGADKGVPRLVVPHHLGGGHHAGKHHPVHQAQVGGLLLQLGADRAVPHEQQQGPLARRLFGQQAEQLAVVFFGGQPPHRDQDGLLPFRQAQGAAQGRLVLRGDGAESLQVDAGGHRVHRAADPVLVQHGGHLAGGGQDGVAPAREQLGQLFDRHMAAALAGDQVAGVIFVGGVVGVHQGAVAPPGQLPRRQKGRELALRVDHVGPPVGQGPHPAVPRGKADPRPGVHPVGAQAAQVDHAVSLVRVAVRRESQHLDVVAQGQELTPQQGHRPDDAVDRRRPPVGGQQYLHLKHLRHRALYQKKSLSL